jgi:hypothetical protein
VIVALELLAIVVVVALKVTDVAPAATVTDEGTVRVELLLDNVTLAPPVGAGCVRATVQVLKVFGPRLVGVQTSEDINTGATRLTAAVAEVLL